MCFGQTSCRRTLNTSYEARAPRGPLIYGCRQCVESRGLQLGDVGGDGDAPEVRLLDRLVGVLEEQGDPGQVRSCIASYHRLSARYMRGVSLQEVVRTVHMKLDLAKLQRRVADVLITDLAKIFDVIAQDVHPIVGARVGLGEASHLATHTEGFSYTLPVGPWQLSTLTQLLGTPQGTIQGVHAGTMAALPLLRFMDIAYRASMV